MKNISKKRYILVGIIMSIVVLFTISTSMYINSDKIIKNTYIDSVNVGNLTKEQAKKILEEKYSKRNIELNYLNSTWIISPNDIDLNYNLEEVIQNAYEVNKKKSYLVNILNTVKYYTTQKLHLDVVAITNQELLKNHLDDIKKEISSKVENAKIDIDNDKIIVTKEKDGKTLDIQKNLDNIIGNISNKNFKIELEVDTIKASIKESDLKEVNTLLGEYSTKFDSRVIGRSSNVILAATRTSDKLLMPGDIFSYNENTGKRTIVNGYKNAPVIVQGIVQEGVGGGVCQVSSTLYNAVLYADLELVSIKNHSIPSAYVPKGRDATVADGGIDFVFKNNFKHPIYIKNYVDGNKIISRIYGNSKDKKNIEIRTNIDKVYIAPIKEVEDPTILEGEEKELEKGRNGYTVSTYRIYKDDKGNIKDSEKVFTSYYPKKQGIIAIGIKIDKSVKDLKESDVQIKDSNNQQQQTSDEE